MRVEGVKNFSGPSSTVTDHLYPRLANCNSRCAARGGSAGPPSGIQTMIAVLSPTDNSIWISPRIRDWGDNPPSQNSRDIAADHAKPLQRLTLEGGCGESCRS